MKNFARALSAALFLFVFAAAVPAQDTRALTRTIVKNDAFDFGSGGTISIIGAPAGSITVEGWSKNEVEIAAEITVEGATDQELDQMAKVVGFQLDESSGRVGIISLGTHDKKYLRKVDKKFPKDLLNNEFSINYVLKVPRYSDVDIDGGKGDLKISGIDGSLKVNYLDTNATLELRGGGLLAVFGKGDVKVSIPSRSWRGRFADVQLAVGNLSVDLPVGLNADVDATILRTGAIENEFEGFKPRVRRQEFTEKLIEAKSGTGGVSLKFSVGDGKMKITSGKSI